MREGQGHDGLLTGGMLLQAGGGRRHMQRQGPAGQRGFRQGSETAVDEVQDRLAVEGPADPDDDVIRDDQFAVQFREVRRFDPCQGLRRAARVDRQRMGAEILTLETQARLLDDIVFGLAASADEGGALGGESLRTELRVQDAVGHQFGELIEIRTQGLTPETTGHLRTMIGEGRAESVD